MKRLLLILPLFLLPVFLLSGPARADIVLQPHRALYDITLKAVRNSGQVNNIKGRMSYSLSHECDAWSTDHRFTIEYGFSSRDPLKMASSFTSWETDDGTQFSFSSIQERNGIKDKEIRGSAERPNRYAIGQVNYAEPFEGEKTLDSDIYFPTAHTQEFLRLAAAGEKIFHALVFDGADETGAREVNGFVIGPVTDPLTGVTLNDNIDKALLPKAWNVRMAFFPAKEKSPNPEYEMTVTFQENGIVSHMTVDYPEFTVEHALTALEPLPDKPCE